MRGFSALGLTRGFLGETKRGRDGAQQRPSGSFLSQSTQSQSREL